MKSSRIILVTACVFSIIFSSSGFAAGQLGEQSGTDAKFREVFLTAGYSAAFGAAVGAALLPFSQRPTKNLNLVASGASVGFLAGSLFGFVNLQKRWSPDTGSPTDVPADELDWIEPAHPSSGALLKRHNSKTVFQIPAPLIGPEGVAFALVDWSF